VQKADLPLHMAAPPLPSNGAQGAAFTRELQTGFVKSGTTFSLMAL
jgi:hypothetical protein